MAISQKHALRAGGQSDVCPALGLVSGTGPCRASPEERKGSRGAHLGLPPHPTRNAKRKQGQETRDVIAKDRKATLGCLIVKTVMTSDHTSQEVGPPSPTAWWVQQQLRHYVKKCCQPCCGTPSCSTLHLMLSCDMG